MTTRTIKVREALRALAIASLYIVGAAVSGIGLAVISEAHAAPIVEGR